MRVLIIVLLVATAGVLGWRATLPSHLATERQPASSHSSENTPLCPWRDPDADLAALFPGATGFDTETRVLSAVLVEARNRLGRMLASDENPLRVYHARGAAGTVGLILVRRLRGEHGAIELVCAFDTTLRIRGIRVQSQREPDRVASAITNNAWLASFVGKNSSSDFRIGSGLPSVPDEARESAEAIAAGVRDGCILLELGSGVHPGQTDSSEHAHSDHP